MERALRSSVTLSLIPTARKIPRTICPCGSAGRNCHFPDLVLQSSRHCIPCRNFADREKLAKDNCRNIRLSSRTAIQVSLEVVAIELRAERRLLGGFDPFG